MKKESHTLLILLVISLFAVACIYSSLDAVVEANFLSGKKYEDRNVEEVYAEKQSNPDVALVSPALFIPLPGIIFQILPGFSFSDTLITQTSSVLRCWLSRRIQKRSPTE